MLPVVAMYLFRVSSKHFSLPVTAGIAIRLVGTHTHRNLSVQDWRQAMQFLYYWSQQYPYQGVNGHSLKQLKLRLKL